MSLFSRDFGFQSKVKTINESDRRVIIDIPDSYANEKKLAKGRYEALALDKDGSMIAKGEVSVYYDENNHYRLYILKEIAEVLVRQYGTSSNTKLSVTFDDSKNWIIHEL